MPPDLQSLRAKLKERRRSLDADFIALASQKVAENFWRLRAIQRSKKLAVYMSTAGEIDCEEIIQGAWLRKKRIFVPVLRGKHLNFAPLNSGTQLAPNRFNILEPVYSMQDIIDPRQLDVVVLPLLAFDNSLNRIGMGAGYYDRSFAFSKQRRGWRRPLLIGVAYSFQRVDKLQPAPWDVPLHAVITEKECVGSC